MYALIAMCTSVTFPPNFFYFQFAMAMARNLISNLMQSLFIAIRNVHCNQCKYFDQSPFFQFEQPDVAYEKSNKIRFAILWAALKNLPKINQNQWTLNVDVHFMNVIKMHFLPLYSIWLEFQLNLQILIDLVLVYSIISVKLHGSTERAKLRLRPTPLK